MHTYTHRYTHVHTCTHIHTYIYKHIYIYMVLTNLYFQIVYSCLPGHMVPGAFELTSFTLTCLEDGLWDRAAYSCIPAVPYVSIYYTEL